MVNRAGHVEALYTLARLPVGSSSGRVDHAKGENCIFQSNIDETSSEMLEASQVALLGLRKLRRIQNHAIYMESKTARYLATSVTWKRWAHKLLTAKYRGYAR